MNIKVIFVFLFVFSGFSSAWAHGGCGEKDPSTGLPSKCLPASALVGAVPNLQKQYIEELGIIFNKDPSQIERLCKNPIDVVEHVRPSGSPDGIVLPKICSFFSIQDCTYKGSNVQITLKGSCYGGLHDCGTLAACIKGQVPRENYLQFQTRAASFRSENAPVPKNFQLRPPEGVSQ